MYLLLTIPDRSTLTLLWALHFALVWCQVIESCRNDITCSHGTTLDKGWLVSVGRRIWCNFVWNNSTDVLVGKCLPSLVVTISKLFFKLVQVRLIRTFLKLSRSWQISVNIIKNDFKKLNYAARKNRSILCHSFISILSPSALLFHLSHRDRGYVARASYISLEATLKNQSSPFQNSLNEQLGRVITISSH